MDRAELPIGRRVAWWRTRRRMSQQMLADRLGKSKSWIDKVERGVRRLDRYSTIADLARVLRIDTSELVVGAARQDLGGRGEDELDRVRAALACYDLALTGRDGRVLVPIASAELQRRLGHAWLAYQHGQYPQLLRVLPGLLVGAQRAHAVAPQGESGRLLVQIYRLVAQVVVKLGEPDLGWLAADRAMTAAASDRLGAALAAVPLGQALRALGRHRLALAVTVTAADRLLSEPAPELAKVSARTGGPDRDAALSVCGTLLVEAALAAACCGDGPGTAELLDRADGIAEATGAGRDDEWTGFGPVAVEVARVVVAVRRGAAVEAVAGHERVIRGAAWQRLPAEHRAAYLLDMAGAYLEVGDPTGAGRALAAADRTAPAEVRSRPLGRTLVVEVVRGGPVPAGVAHLAAALGLRVG